MGIEDTARRSIGMKIKCLVLSPCCAVGFFSSKVSLRNRSTTFTLGSRDTVITTGLESPIIVIPHAQKNEKKVKSYNLIEYLKYL